MSVIATFVKVDDWSGKILITNTYNFSVIKWKIRLTGKNIKFSWSDFNVTKTQTYYWLTPKYDTVIKQGITEFGCGISKSISITNVKFNKILPPSKSDYDEANKNRKDFPDKFTSVYVDICNYPTPKIMKTFDAIAQKYYTLAFIVADPKIKKASWGGYYALDTYFFLDQVFDIRKAGGDVIISCGGANGSEIAQVITDETELLKEYQRIVDMYDLRMISFDIEGGSAADKPSIQRRNRVLKKLQQNNKNLKINYCLPVMPFGLTTDGVYLLEDAKKNNVDINICNIMIMDYNSDTKLDMGQAGIDAAKNLRKQLDDLKYNNVKIGLTPMIGINDTQQIFTLENTKQVVKYSQENNIGMLSYWSLIRDHKQTKVNKNDLSNNSGIIQEDYDFLKIMMTL